MVKPTVSARTGDGSGAAPGLPAQAVAQKLIGNVLANVIGQFSTLLIAFAAVPYVVHRVGPDLYGLLVMVAALGGVGGLGIGAGTTIAKFVSESPSPAGQDGVALLLQTAVTLCGGIAILCFAVIIAEKKAIASLLFHSSGISPAIITLTVYVLAFCFLGSLLSDVFSGILIGLQRFGLCSRIRIGTSILRNGGFILVLALGFGIRSLLGVYLLTVLASLAACAGYGYRLMPALTIRPGFAWSHFKRLAGFSIPVVAGGLGALAVHKFDRALVAYYLPLSAVTFYAVPYMLAEKSGVAVSNITSAVFPLSSQLSSARDEARLRELYLRSTKMVVLFAIPVVITLVALSAPVLRWWVGAEYAIKGSLVLELLAIAFLVNTAGHVPYVIAQGLGSPWVSAKYSLLNGVVNVFLFVLLIPRFGIAGAAAGFLISEVLVIPLLIRRVNLALRVSWRALILRSYLRPAGCGVVGLIALWELSGHVRSLPTLALFCSAGIAVYVTLTLTLGIDKRERDGVVAHLLRLARPHHGALRA
jgi:O-antigen/teichoic acid export membrane protein